MSDLLKKQRMSTGDAFKTVEKVDEISISKGLSLDDFADVSVGKSKDDTDIKTKNFDFTNALSGAGMQNLKRVEKGEEPVLDTRYIENTQYKDKYETEELSALKKEFEEKEEYKRRGIFGGEKADSTEMKAVREGLNNLITLLSEQCDLRDATKQNNIFENYRAIIESCNTYLGVSTKGFSKVGKARKRMVERIKDTCQRELNLLPDMINTEIESRKVAAKGKEADFNGSFSDILRQVRSIHLENNKNQNFEITGAGTSTVIKLKMNNKQYYFKEDDTLKELSTANSFNALKEEHKTLCSTGTLKPETANYIQEKTGIVLNALENDYKNKKLTKDNYRVMLVLFQNLIDIDSSEFKAIKKAKEDEKEGYINTLAKNIFKSILREEFTKEYERNSEFYTQFKEVILKEFITLNLNKKGSEENRDKIKAYEQSFEIISKTANTTDVFNGVANIPIGAKISTNNVVSSRIAERLGLSNVMAKSTSAVININGKTLVGNLMEEAKGEHLDELNLKNDKDKAFLETVMADAKTYTLNYNMLTNYQEKLTNRITVTSVRQRLKKNGVTLNSFDTKTLYDEIIKLGVDVYGRSSTLKNFVETYEKTTPILAKLEEIEKQFKDSLKDKDKEKKQLDSILGMKNDEKELNYIDYVNAFNKTMKDAKAFTTYLSGNAKKQMASLAILDYILGQIDRHIGNYLVQTTKIKGRIVVTGITAIDNDCCAGVLDVKKGKTYGRMTNIYYQSGEINVPYMDDEFADNILSLTAEELSHSLVDLLKPEQIASMAKRLKEVQNMIINERKKIEKGTNTIKFIKDEQWDKVGTVKGDQNSLHDFNPYFFNKNSKHVALT